jgi:hypothetical protein
MAAILSGVRGDRYGAGTLNLTLNSGIGVLAPSEQLA